MYRSLVVIDDIYDRPYEIREEALAFDYPEVTGTRTFPGRNSRQRVAPPGFDRLVSSSVGEGVVASALPGAYHGCFRITLAGEESRYQVHVDTSSLTWVGVLYLNLPEQCQGGTAFFRHKGLNSDRTVSVATLQAAGYPDLATLLQRDANDAEKWERLMILPMRFNRLILYRPWLWHSATAGFGERDADGRLVQIFAFQAGNPA